MRKFAILSAVAGFALLSSTAMAQEAPEGDYVCLITFATAEQAAAGADADALDSVYVSRDEAVRLAAESNGLRAYWDYSADYPTNAAEQEFCLTHFGSDSDDNEVPGNSARQFAPGQMKGDGESARDYAPGQVKGEGETGRDHAPGQLNKQSSDEGDDAE